MHSGTNKRVRWGIALAKAIENAAKGESGQC
jgi:hypothetical protein